jgi:hypothetical protein
MNKKIRDKDLCGVEEALRRTGSRARKNRRADRYPLVIYEDGQIVRKKVGRGSKYGRSLTWRSGCVGCTVPTELFIWNWRLSDRKINKDRSHTEDSKAGLPADRGRS